MKKVVLLLALLFAVTLISSSSIASKASPDGKKHKAVMQFNEPVRLRDVVLKGEYLFVHDDEAMARGEACTFVYRGSAPIANKLVLSFHCIPAQRLKVNDFTVRLADVAGVTELREYQFAGDTEAHLVPVTK